jgi:hypothetical protein
MLHEAGGAGVPDGVSTQPSNNTPEDAKALLIGEQVEGQDELVEPNTSTTSAGGPFSQSEYGVHLNAESDSSTEGTVQAPSPAADEEPDGDGTPPPAQSTPGASE